MLLNRRVPVPYIYALYNLETELILHLLVRCGYAQQVWTASNVGWYRPNVATFVEWLAAMIQLFNESDACMILWTCWSIWNSKNSVLWENRYRSLVQTWMSAKCTQDAWQNAQVKNAKVPQ